MAEHADHSTPSSASSGSGALAALFEHLSIQYPTNKEPVVQSLSISVPAGARVVVAGESGGGKSLLIRSLLGMAPVASGRVLVGGVDVARASGRDLAAVRRRIGVLFQDPVGSLDPGWNALALVSEAVRLRTGCRTAKAELEASNLLAAVGIPAGRWRDKPRSFSGGECQRIGLARGVAGNPGMVLADEPTAMLDPENSRMVIELLDSLQAAMGFTLLMVTHRLEEAGSLNPLVLHLCRGRAVEFGPPPVRHPFAVYLQTAAGQAVPLAKYSSRGCPFHPSCPRAMPVCSVEFPREPIRFRDSVAWCHALAVT